MVFTTEHGYQTLTLCIPRHSTLPPSAGPAEHLSRPTVVSSHVQDVGVGGVIPPNHILLRVERFGFSANNVTYGLLGEEPYFRYFDFYPAPTTSSTSPKTHGVIPVWGFGTVLQSTYSGIRVGERVFGYMGMTRYLLLPIEAANKHNFYVPRPHFPEDRRPYNQLTRCDADPLYDSEREKESMIFRPLFWTSFWCEDWLCTTGAFDSASCILISSASAKTAYCLAFVVGLRRKYRRVALPKDEKWRKGQNCNPTIIGATSKKNLRFTQKLGLYDEVLTYDQVEELGQREHAWIYIDVAGNSEFNIRALKILSSNLIKSVSLGMSDPSGGASSPSSTQTLEFFFMPEWLAHRKRDLTAQEVAHMQAGAWDALLRSCDQWIKTESVWWAGSRSWMDETKGVLDVYQECIAGELGPDRGIIMSLWSEEELKSVEKATSKL